MKLRETSVSRGTAPNRFELGFPLGGWDLWSQAGKMDAPDIDISRYLTLTIKYHSGRRNLTLGWISKCSSNGGNHSLESSIVRLNSKPPTKNRHKQLWYHQNSVKTSSVYNTQFLRRRQSLQSWGSILLPSADISNKFGTLLPGR